MAICVGEQPSDVERILETYQASNPQYTRMLSSRDNWIMGTPEQARAQLQGLAEAGIDRALVSVNADLHREMIALLSV